MVSGVVKIAPKTKKAWSWASKNRGKNKKVQSKQDLERVYGYDIIAVL